MALKVHIAGHLPGKFILHYTLQLMALNKGVEFHYCRYPHQADIVIDDSNESDLPIAPAFYQKLTTLHEGAPIHLPNDGYDFRNAEGKEDKLASVFYLVNALQEYQAGKKDQYGRFPYAESLQAKNNLLQQNIVQDLIDSLWSQHPKFRHIKTSKKRSTVFLTHDIDTLFGSKNQNGAYALQQRLYHRIPGLLWNHYLGRPEWMNIEHIMKLESSLGFKSVFYWLVFKDKQNADYEIGSPQIRAQFNKLEQEGFGAGLHKSLHESSFADELGRLNIPAVSQRYHFLRFRLPDAWLELEQAGIKIDTSLGFSEDFGFRNSYGLPFMPFNLWENRVFKVLEVPMQIMDRTFFNQGISTAEAENKLIDWLDKHKDNAVFAINFHNNFFDKMQYSGYEELYRALLKYFKEEGIKPVTETELLNDYFKPFYFNYEITVH